MNIVSVSTIETGNIRVELEDGRVMFIPDDMTVRARKKLKEEYEDKGGVIPPYIPPTPPTDAELDDELMERIKTVGTFERAVLEVLYQLATTPHDPAITKQQFFNFFKNKLRG